MKSGLKQKRCVAGVTITGAKMEQKSLVQIPTEAISLWKDIMPCLVTTYLKDSLFCFFIFSIFYYKYLFLFIISNFY